MIANRKSLSLGGTGETCSVTALGVPRNHEVARLEAHKRLAERGEKFGWPLPADYALVEVKEARE